MEGFCTGDSLDQQRPRRRWQPLLAQAIDSTGEWEIAMKQWIRWIAVWLIAFSLSGAAADTPPGFGYINTNQTNVRKGVGGPIVTQLHDGDAVYIVSQQRDAKDRLWYHVNSEHNGDHPFTVWVQARYVTAGSELFHDIVQVAAGEKGILALQSDGTVVGVGDENVNTRVFRQTIAQWKNVKQVACGFMTYIALLEDGSLRGFGNMAYEDWNSVRDVRLLDAMGSNIAYITTDGVCNQESVNPCYTIGEPLDWQRAGQITACDFGVIARYPDGGVTVALYKTANVPGGYQSIADWHDLAAVDCGCWSFTMQGTDAVHLRPLLVGLHMDGTVSMLPAHQIPEAETWTDITDVKAGWECIIGLRADGTVIAAGGDGALARQVAQWTDITAIDACMGYCVGLKTDGTLVFAGEYTF